MKLALPTLHAIMQLGNYLVVSWNVGTYIAVIRRVIDKDPTYAMGRVGSELWKEYLIRGKRDIEIKREYTEGERESLYFYVTFSIPLYIGRYSYLKDRRFEVEELWLTKVKITLIPWNKSYHYILIFI